MLDKMNKVYFARLKECLADKLGTAELKDVKNKDIDVETFINSNLSIYTIMADYILESSERKPDINRFKAVLADKIKKDAKTIVAFVNDNVEEYIQVKGEKKASEFKQMLVGEVLKTLSVAEKKNIYMEQEKEA